jgi:mannitol/fructose-specific phosphotransferase system IIA component
MRITQIEKNLEANLDATDKEAAEAALKDFWEYEGELGEEYLEKLIDRAKQIEKNLN